MTSKQLFLLNNNSKSNGADSDSFQEKQWRRLIRLLALSIPRCILEKAALTKVGMCITNNGGEG